MKLLNPLAVLTMFVYADSGCSILSSGGPAENQSPVPISTTLEETLPCPVTIANGDTPPHQLPSPGHHGNGDLWTLLWEHGKVLSEPEYVDDKGWMHIKWLWWRLERGAKLSIEGHRLDASAPPLQADIIQPEAYRGNFQATVLVFPSEGCWEVTGSTDQGSLTFVTLVVKLSVKP